MRWLPQSGATNGVTSTVSSSFVRLPRGRMRPTRCSGPRPPLRLQAARVSEAYDAVHRVVDAQSTGSAGAVDDEPRLSLDFPGGTLFDLLNALARSHGRLHWSLTSKAETIFLDGTRAVEAVEPMLSLGGESVSLDIRFVFAATPR